MNINEKPSTNTGIDITQEKDESIKISSPFDIYYKALIESINYDVTDKEQLLNPYYTPHLLVYNLGSNS